MGHRIENCDCFDFMRTLHNGSVDLVLVDPPYGTTSNKWDAVISFDRMWSELLRVGKESCAFVFTASQPFSSALVMSKVELFRHEWIWLKNRGSNFANTVREPFKEHEQVLVFSRGGWTYNKQMQERTGSGGSRVKYDLNFRSKSENYREFEGREAQLLPEMRVPSSWQKFNTACGAEKVKHPTQKPVELMEYLVKTYSNQGEYVLDFCMGSGTTGVACKNLDRWFLGCESNAEYFKIAEQRMLATNDISSDGQGVFAEFSEN